MNIKAMKLAQELRALADRFSEGWHDGIKIDASDIMLLSTAAEAIEQAQKQEPVAWQWLNTAHFRKKLPKDAEQGAWTPLYTAPPQRQPLMDEQFRKIIGSLSRHEGWDGDSWDLALKEAIEAAHGIKENT